MAEFVAWPKIPRLNREIVVTEKIDGTNACIVIDEDGVHAQSRKRMLSVDQDNFEFARWVQDNAEGLALDLGEGRHYGEWWGSGIQRGYGLSEKRFSLFNTTRWADTSFTTPGLTLVPELYRGPFDQDQIAMALIRLRAAGSFAAPTFPKPEGVIVYHVAANAMFKVTIENDDVPKGVAQ